MVTIPGYKTLYVDVDDTPVMWGSSNEDVVAFDNHGMTEYLLPNTKNIKTLVDFKQRGGTVVVWSQAGYDWAEEVVKVLNLEQYVDLCITKPAKIIDDLAPSEWIGENLYEE